MEARIEKNWNADNCPIPGKREVKAVVYVVMRSCEHYDDLVTAFFSLEEAKKFCSDVEDYYIAESNVF